jgi:hypothetical protein
MPTFFGVIERFRAKVLSASKNPNPSLERRVENPETYRRWHKANLSGT